MQLKHRQNIRNGYHLSCLLDLTHWIYSAILGLTQSVMTPLSSLWSLLIGGGFFQLLKRCSLLVSQTPLGLCKQHIASVLSLTHLCCLEIRSVQSQTRTPMIRQFYLSVATSQICSMQRFRGWMKFQNWQYLRWRNQGNYLMQLVSYSQNDQNKEPCGTNSSWFYGHKWWYLFVWSVRFFGERQ